MRAVVTPAAPQENPAWAASESLLVGARKRSAGIDAAPPGWGGDRV